MLLKAGALSLALLLASRLLGLLRESALAATFGTSGLADVAILMLTLPDWLAGVLASGALAYVLLPAWAGPEPAQVAASQRRVAQVLIFGGTALAVLLALLREPAVDWLAGGLPLALRPEAAQALIWSALALPAALLAALWTTRLQHERDFLGMYSASLVVNVSLLISIVGTPRGAGHGRALFWLGCGLLAAMVLRLAWLRWRQKPELHIASAQDRPDLPAPAIWLWAVLSAGLPLALPFAARSMASQAAEGALATFNYAWKLIELPLLLAIQLVATLAFPAIAKAIAGPSGGPAPAGAAQPIRNAFALAFALACACAVCLIVGAPAITQLLYGWGRMEPAALAEIAQWARIGAWGLLPQALIAVALTVLATRRRMRAAVLAYALALAILLALGTAGVTGGANLMAVLNALLAAVAAVVIFALGPQVRRNLPWGVIGSSATAVLVIANLSPWIPAPSGLPLVLEAALCACLVLAVAWLADRSAGREAAHNSDVSP